MKKFVVMLAVIGVAMVLGVQAQDVTSVNVVGYQNTDVDAAEYVLVAAPFYVMGTDNSIQTIFGDQFTGGANAGEGDQILFWDGSEYKINWKHTSGTWVEEGFASTQAIDQARGFWVKSNAGGDQVMSLLGEVVDDAVVTQRVSNGLNLLAYPYNASILVTNTTLDAVAQGGADPGAGDNLIKWNAGIQDYETYWKHTSGNWVKDGFADNDAVLGMGEGFWYVRRGAGVDWVESIPYTLQ